MSEELKPQAEVVEGASATPPVQEPQATPVQEPPQQQPGESISSFQKRINQLTAARRAAEERARSLEEQLAQIQTQRTPVSPRVQQEPMVGTMPKSEWEAWHAEDPVAAYSYLADIRADQKAQQIITQISTQNQYAGAVGEVYKAHPELKDVMEGNKTAEEVPFWQVYDEVAREMPDARFLAKGPILVMKEAERRMKERDMLERERAATQEGATAEANRQVRVGAAHTLSSSPKPPVSTVKLNADEEKIARKFGIAPEEYAKNKKVK